MFSDRVDAESLGREGKLSECIVVMPCWKCWTGVGRGMNCKYYISLGSCQITHTVSDGLWIKLELLGLHFGDWKLSGWQVRMGARTGLEWETASVPTKGFPGGSMVKNLPADAGDVGDTGSIPGLERSPGGGHGNPLQYFCWENAMDRQACQATVHGAAKSQTGLKWLQSDRTHACTATVTMGSLLLHSISDVRCIMQAESVTARTGNRSNSI